MRLHFNANSAHIGNRFPFLLVSLLIIDRNFPPFPRIPAAISYQWLSATKCSYKLAPSAEARAIPIFNSRVSWILPSTKGERRKEKGSGKSELHLHNGSCCRMLQSLASRWRVVVQRGARKNKRQWI